MRAMTCREFDEVVHGFVRMELLDMDVREDALEHASRCSNCGERMIEAGLLAETAEAVADSAREQQAPASVEAELLTAFRKQVRHTAWRRTFEWATAGAVAAVLLVFLWTHTLGSKEQSSPLPRKDVSSQSQTPLSAAAAGLSQPNDGTEPADVEIADTSSATYAMTDFVPVPFTEGFSPEDLGMVVRVQLTRASLAELGYPVADTPDEELVRADVLVDQDGWPQGVKLAQ